MQVNIPINKPIIGEEEAELVKKITLSGMFTNPQPEGGEWVKKFEEAFANYVDTKNAVSVNSGTSALYASLLAADVGGGDEVIVPPFTFPSTADVVLLVGAKPIFADVNIDTYNIEPDDVKKKITKNTKAIIPVHLYGLSADMSPIMEIAKDNDLVVIEDACQSHGSEYHGKKTGSLGHIGCFSFYPSKIITTGEGGMITTNDDELADKLRLIRTHGHGREYETVLLGTNLRMPELEAAIGFTQLSRIESFLTARKTNANYYNQVFTPLENANLPTVPKGYKHNWYLYTIRLKEDEKQAHVLLKLRSQGIGAKVYYPYPIHTMPYYVKLGYGNETYPNSELAAKSVISLPVHPGVTRKEADYIKDAVLSVIH